MSEPVCPYCRTPFDETAPAKLFCTACGTPHHEDCYQENGGCTVFGCARAPADDPKLLVSQSDLSAIVVPVQPTVSVPQYPVPQYPPSQRYPPSTYGGLLGLSQPARGVQPPVVTYAGVAKSRTTYIVLGIFLGALGVHNFYAGYTGRAVGQLCLSVLTLGYLALAAWIWAIIEICVVDKDSAGIHFS